MKSSDLLMYGAIAAAGYYAYTKGYLNSLFGSTSTVASGPSTTVWTPSGNMTIPTAMITPTHIFTPDPGGPVQGSPSIQLQLPAAATSSDTLGDLYAKLQSITAEVGNQLTADQWTSALRSVASFAPPSPYQIWGTNPARQMRIEEYWANVGPWLAANRGMSGLGMGGWYA